MQHPPRLVIAAAFWLASAGSPAAEPAVLRLTDGGFVTGTLADSDDPKTLRWQGDAFTAPFDFDAGAVNSVDRPTPAHPPRPAGTYRFELAGGDVLFGSLVDLDGAAAVIDSPRFGRLHLPRRNLRRLDRWHDRVDLVYMGPNGLSGWKGAKSGPENPWRDDAGALFATRAGVEARADVNLPAGGRRVPDVLAVEARFRARPGRGRRRRERPPPSGSRSGTASWSSCASRHTRPTWPRSASSPPEPAASTCGRTSTRTPAGSSSCPSPARSSPT